MDIDGLNTKIAELENQIKGLKDRPGEKDFLHLGITLTDEINKLKKEALDEILKAQQEAAEKKTGPGWFKF